MLQIRKRDIYIKISKMKILYTQKAKLFFPSGISKLTRNSFIRPFIGLFCICYRGGQNKRKVHVYLREAGKFV